MEREISTERLARNIRPDKTLGQIGPRISANYFFDTTRVSYIASRDHGIYWLETFVGDE